MYGCENWTIKKAECRTIDAFELWCWRRLLRAPWTARRSNQSVLKEISPGCPLKGLIEAETPVLWPPDVKSWLIWEDPDAGKDWGQEEKGMTEDEMVGWHHSMGMSLGKFRELVMDREAWHAVVHGAGKSWIWLSDWAELNGPNILGLYAILFFTTSDFISHIHTGCYFHFGSDSSFNLELFLHSSPVAYWASTDLGSSSFSIISFCFFILFMGFSRQEYRSGLPFPSPVDQVLSELSTMTHPSWVALHSMAHSFIELDKAMIHVISLFSFLWLYSDVLCRKVK